jgi:Ca-activated chloride channel family protein
VGAYKLIGYENRLMAQEDFKDDTKDAGEIGAGHTVTALYEIIPVDTMARVPGPDRLKYQEIKVKPRAFKSKEILTLKIRYKEPDRDKSQLIIKPVRENYVFLAESSENFRFSSAVAEFGLRLRDNVFRNFFHYKRIIERAKAAKGSDEYGYRAEFIRLVEICQAMAENNVKNSGLKKGG